MLTLFTTAKPFVGHVGVIQRNALKSWTLLHSDVEVILFGEEEGVADVCAELGLAHHRQVDRHESGLKCLNYMFDRAQTMGRHKYLCYANCDMILMSDFYNAFKKALNWRRTFLLIGQRRDTDIIVPVHFDESDWARRVREMALTHGVLRSPRQVDFFLFPKGLYDEVPSFVVGRDFWDHWLVWKALNKGAKVLDASGFVIAVHQNHGYGYHPLGRRGIHEDVLTKRNVELAGNGKHLRFTIHATHRMNGEGRIRWAPFHTVLWKAKFGIQGLLNATYPIRRTLGLERKAWLGSLLHSRGNRA